MLKRFLLGTRIAPCRGLALVQKRGLRVLLERTAGLRSQRLGTSVAPGVTQKPFRDLVAMLAGVLV